MEFTPFDQQEEFMRSKKRIRCLFAAKRAGKSEPCYLDTIIRGQNQPDYIDNGRDPYLMAIIAPTEGMLKRLVWPKFRKFAASFESKFNKSDNIFTWKDKNTILYGISAEKISRMEGLKLNHIHLTEAFQMEEFALLESLARVSDTQGTIVIDGSLGPNLPNPKRHWLYRTFKQNKFPGSRVWEWTTGDNPHFPKDELRRLKDALDAKTYRQMFEIDWNTSGTALVYDDLDEANLTRGYVYNPELETYVVIDWGWAHEMAALFFQYDRKNDTVYLFDEIVGSKISLEKLWDRIKAKNYRIHTWICDIAGNQEREQTGYSNVQWFRNNHQVSFKYRSSAVSYGIPIVRTYLKNGMGQRRFMIDEVKCPKSLDGLRNYSYPEKNGAILNENPIKKDDDAVDAIRYFFVNILDYNRAKDTMKNFDRWSIK